MVRKSSIAMVSFLAVTQLLTSGFCLGPSVEAMKQESGIRFNEGAAVRRAPAGDSLAVLADMVQGGDGDSVDASAISRFGSLAIQEPPLPGFQTERHGDGLRRRYAKAGARIGSIAGAAALGALGAAAGAPSLIGAVAAGLLFGWVGAKAGAAAGRALGRAIAEVKIAVCDFAHKAKACRRSGTLVVSAARLGRPEPCCSC